VTTAYRSAAGLGVEEQVHVYVMALFGYAAEHPDGFRILFEVQPFGETARIRQDLVDVITQRVAEQIRHYLAEHGRSPGASAEMLAAMMVGVVGQAAEHMLRLDGLEPATAGEFATRFIMAALRNLDPAFLDIIDRATPPMSQNGPLSRPSGEDTPR
jgi:hypothetical protein